VKIPFVDLQAAAAELHDELDDAWRRVSARGVYILGEEVAAFEDEFASFCGTAHCVGVASGLDALRLLLEAAGIGANDEVIVPAYTAVATWMAVTAAGARPVGVDVDRSTFNIDPALVERAITARTKAIIAVHLFGRPADMSELSEIADNRDLTLLEDAAQAHGALREGRRVGSLAKAAAFSFYPTKNLGALGDGGAVTTDDDALAERVRMLRSYGWRQRSVSEIFGVNSRLDELQAAFLRVRLRALDAHNERRRKLARLYSAALDEVPGVATLGEPEHATPVWHVYPVQVEERAMLEHRLRSLGIETLVHYDPIPHQTPAYRSTGWVSGDFPVSEAISQRELSLPMYPQLSDEAVAAVTAALAS
jgi:dTDP-4-amino-4,6-dideoxygalactose transaminase